MAVTVGDRRVFLVKGKGRSNTVNICNANNRRGEYDWVIRFIEPTPFITEADTAKFQAIPDFVKWLKERGGRLEQVPPSDSADAPAPIPDSALGYDPASDPWLEEARWHVGHALDLLAHEFIEFPYPHRVEQSLHARLFQMLSTQPHFSRVFPLKVHRRDALG